MAAKATNTTRRGNPGVTRGNLDARARKFCELHAAGKSGTEAAVEAGYAPKSAKVRAAKLLARPAIKAYLAELTAKATADALNSPAGQRIRDRARARVLDKDDAERLAAEIRERLLAIGFGDIRDLANWDEAGNVTFTASDRLTDEQAAMVSSITKLVKKAGDLETTEIKLTTHSSLSALRELARILGMFAPNKVEHTGKDGGPIRTESKGLSAATVQDLRAQLLGIRHGQEEADEETEAGA